MNTLYLISGVPGSGKSTLARGLQRAGLVDVVWENDRFRMNDDGVYEYSDSFADPCEACFQETMTSMIRKLNIAVANTFTKDVYLERYLTMAERFRYNVVEIVMKSNFKSTKDIKPERVSQMRYQLQDRLEADWALE